MTAENPYPNSRIVVDGLGTEKKVRPASHTLIEKPPQTYGITTFSDHIDILQELAEARKDSSLWQEEVTVKIHTDKEWFGVRPFGDTHIGHMGVDYDYLRDYLAGLRMYSNLAAVGTGDLGDFFTPRGSPPDGILGDVVTPQEQVHALRKFFTEFEDKFLAITNDPSHTDWVYQSAGIDVYEWLVAEKNIPLIYQGGVLKVDFGRVSYDILLFHNISKFKSSFNLTHAHKRALELHRDADAVITGHIHKWAHELTNRNGHDAALIQAGTMKVLDSWGAKQGMLGRPQCVYPILLLNTEDKRMVVVKTLEDAEAFLEL